MKTTVIHHSADYDGLFCREIARKFLPEAELIGWDYGDAPVPVPEGQIYILDLSPDCLFTKGAEPDPKVWTGLFERMVWIDHHKSAIEKWGGTGLHDTIPGYRIDGVAACRLAWQYFNRKSVGTVFERICTCLPEKQAFIDRIVSEPLAVRLAGEYDIWDKRDPNAELFQHGLRSVPLTDGIWDELLAPRNIPNLVDQLLENGRTIQFVQTEQNASIIKQLGFTVTFEGLRFLACNHARYNSFLFTAGLTPEHDACFGFKWARDHYEVSLYHAPGKEHHDLSQIAVKYGGGGHRGACGFRCHDLEFKDGKVNFTP